MSVLVETGVRPVRRSVPAPIATHAIRWGTVLVLLAVWELLCHGPLEHNRYIVGPITVVRDGVPVVFRHDSLLALWHTTLRFLIAFLITAVLGIVLGVIFGSRGRHVFAGLRDVVSVLYSLPMAPFYPLFVLWLGLGNRSEIAFGVIHGVIPVVLMVMAATAEVPTNLVVASRAMGAGRSQRFLHVLAPASVPQIISALKIGAALTLLGVLLAELMISVGGIGSFMAAQVAAQRGAVLDAVVVVVCIGALIVNAVLSTIERYASRWQHA